MSKKVLSVAGVATVAAVYVALLAGKPDVARFRAMYRMSK